MEDQKKKTVTVQNKTEQNKTKQTKKNVAHQNCTVDKQCNTLCEQCINTVAT